MSMCSVGVCSSPVHCNEIGHCFSRPKTKENVGPGSPTYRFNVLLTELHKRFPHPNPFDSTKAPEQYVLEAIDTLIQKEKDTAAEMADQGPYINKLRDKIKEQMGRRNDDD